MGGWHARCPLCRARLLLPYGFGERRHAEGGAHGVAIVAVVLASALQAGSVACCERHRIVGMSSPARSADLDKLLNSVRLRRGRGVDRSADRITWQAPYRSLPDGAVVIGEQGWPQLVVEDHLRPFTFAGWGPPTSRPVAGVATVLTPPTSCAALAFGFEPVLSIRALPQDQNNLLTCRYATDSGALSPGSLAGYVLAGQTACGHVSWLLRSGLLRHSYCLSG